MGAPRPFLDQYRQLPFGSALESWVEQARRDDWVRRIWGRDATLWTGRDEARWLAWLDAPQRYEEALASWFPLVHAAPKEGLRHIALLGMGGSSLCPYVWSRTFGSSEAAVRLWVLDSTVPDQIQALVQQLDLEHTWFIVSSKSGTTAETLALRSFFEHYLVQQKGDPQYGHRWLALTDPATPLEAYARARGYRACILGDPGIGGRFSAFSPYGLVPGLLMGAPITELLFTAKLAQASCTEKDPYNNEAALLGIVLGGAALLGRDKLTLIASEPLQALGWWLEQLVAESTGKDGRGIIPVVDEPLGRPELYADDRLFVYLRYEAQPNPDQEDGLQHLQEHGQPVLTLNFEDLTALGEWMYRWEFAVAVAGGVLKINPFDQPDVEATKEATRALLASFEHTGRLSEFPWIPLSAGVRLAALEGPGSPQEPACPDDAPKLLEAWMRRATAGRSYVSIHAFLPETGPLAAEVVFLRRRLRDLARCAVAFNYGPRYLHSTGQLHKGGPAEGLFLFLLGQDQQDFAVPGAPYSFGTLKRAQALADAQTLAARGRPVMLVDLGRDLLAGLTEFRTALEHLGLSKL
jgi:transaldolase/glucose-6-phosphate isomerase